MSKTLVRFFSNVLFWTYPRGGWQYDILCGLILAFIFLTPKSVFDGTAFHGKDKSTIIKSDEEIRRDQPPGLVPKPTS